MSLITPEMLAQNYWVHQCDTKDGSDVHNQKGQACPFCALTEEAQAAAAAPTTTTSKKKKK